MSAIRASIAQLVTAAALLGIPAAHAAGQGAAADRLPARHAAGAHAIPVPSVDAEPRTSPIVIDGKLDDAAWSAAQAITTFTQYTPDEGKPASERTDVRILYDDDAIYVGAKMYDSHGRAGVTTRLVRRDDDFNSDYFQLVIDGYHDHLSRAFFAVNPSGSKQDQLGIGTSCCDAGWDPVWEAATHIDDDGWTAEIRIPLSQLRYQNDSVQTWGLEIRRWIQRRQEEDDWSFWHKNESGGPARFGHLDDIHIHKSPRHLELLPYVVGRSKDVAAAPGDPFNSGNVQSARTGLDLKYLLTSNLTLDATVNPDFGQVEVDPAVINLSAFETFFPEKRPFFVEGSGVFDFGSFNCYFCSNTEALSGFYSRRVGRAPTGADLALNNYTYADVPDATTILGAGKITGRTNNGFTVGMLDAVTGQANAAVESANGQRGTQEVEPLTNYFVGRVKRDYMGGDLVVGGILSTVVRRMDSTFAPRLDRDAEMLGTDFQYTWNNRAYSLIGSAAITNLEGDPRAVYDKQLGSARYFERPDRGAGFGGFFSDRLDSTATGMRGGGAYLRLGKDAGEWLWEAGFNGRTPGYESNDYAFQQRADYLSGYANVFRHWTQPTSWYRDLAVIAGAAGTRNFEGDVTAKQMNAFVQATTPQYWSVSGFYIWRPSAMSDVQLRGGPVVRLPTVHYVENDISTDSRHSVVFTTSANYASNADGGWGNGLSVSASVRPTSNVTLSLGPAWAASNSARQYVAATADPTATAFYGTRYTMSWLAQRQLSLDTRLNVTFTPNMTLEFYAQPFVASGHYYRFEEFLTPRTDNVAVYGRDRGTIMPQHDATGSLTGYTIDPDGAGPTAPFTIDNPDFNFRSLRGNAVFRWEYHPGSVLYLAWTQTRSDEVPLGDFDFARDRTALFAVRPDNIFLAKISWWLPR